MCTECVEEQIAISLGNGGFPTTTTYLSVYDAVFEITDYNDFPEGVDRVKTTNPTFSSVGYIAGAMDFRDHNLIILVA